MGLSGAAFGLVLQWSMSLLIAAIFVVAAWRLRILGQRWMASGLVYGVIVFFVMNGVVVPLSAAGITGKFPAAVVIENLLAMLLFGLIIAFFARDTASRAVHVVSANGSSAGGR